MAEKKAKPGYQGEELVMFRGDVPPGEITVPLPDEGEDGETHFTVGSINGQVGVPADLVEAFESLPMIERGLKAGTIRKDDPKESKSAKKASGTTAATIESAGDEAKAVNAAKSGNNKQPAGK